MKVAVIMSTYNGEKYIREQIDSILNQSDVEVELFIRDDGSQDGTVDIIRKYEKNNGNVHLEVGTNLGFRQSFMQKLLSVKGFEFYAFSDQDDFWEKEKLYQGCMNLKEVKGSIPAVYYSNLNVADENLRILGKTKLENRVHSLESVLLRRSIAGCTMVFNDRLREVIIRHNISEEMLKRGHDSFLMTLCYAIGGDVICDSNAYIKYRQHSNNTSGGKANFFLKRVKKEFVIVFEKKNHDSDIAEAVIKEFKEINIEAKESLNIVASSPKSWKSRFIIVFSKKFRTGNLLLTCEGKVKALIGYL